MRSASLCLVGLFVGACFNPTQAPSGVQAGTDATSVSSETSSSDGDASTSSSEPTPPLDDTGESDGTSSSTGVDGSSDGGSSETGQDPYAEWAFHREVVVSPVDEPRVGYQVELQLPASDPFSPGGADIRVVDDDGVELPIWFDDPGFGDSVSIWVKMDLDLVEEVPLMIHYGNDEAPSVMEPAAVFEFYDDFATLDPEVWWNSGDWIAEDGVISTDRADATSIWSSDAPMIVEARMRWEGGGTQPSSGIALDSSFGTFGIAGMPVSIFCPGFSDIEVPRIAPAAWTRVRIVRSEEVQVVLDLSAWVGWDLPLEPYRIYLGRVHGEGEPRDTVSIDWLFVRQGGIPPIVTVGRLM